MEKSITKNVVFQKKDYSIVQNFVKKHGLGERGFSAALRQIIRDWDELQADRFKITPAGRAALAEAQQSEEPGNAS